MKDAGYREVLFFLALCLRDGCDPDVEKERHEYNPSRDRIHGARWHDVRVTQEASGSLASIQDLHLPEWTYERAMAWAKALVEGEAS